MPKKAQPHAVPTVRPHDALVRLLLRRGGKTVTARYDWPPIKSGPEIEAALLRNGIGSSNASNTITVQTTGGADAFKELADAMQGWQEAATAPAQRQEGFLGYALTEAGEWLPHAWSKDWSGGILDRVGYHESYFGVPLSRFSEYGDMTQAFIRLYAGGKEPRGRAERQGEKAIR